MHLPCRHVENAFFKETVQGSRDAFSIVKGSVALFPPEYTAAVPVEGCQVPGPVVGEDAEVGWADRQVRAHARDQGRVVDRQRYLFAPGLLNTPFARPYHSYFNQVRTLSEFFRFFPESCQKSSES